MATATALVPQETPGPLAAPRIDAAVLEALLIKGDLAQLAPAQRLDYVRAVCESVGLNPLTKPFDFIKNRQGQLILYARRDCAEQLRKVHHISVAIVSREVTGDMYVVTARATEPSGRADESIGAVSLENLRGEDRANAMMKCETKAKRRVSLSICGLGLLDESETAGLQSVPPMQLPTVGELQAGAGAGARVTKPAIGAALEPPVVDAEVVPIAPAAPAAPAAPPTPPPAPVAAPVPQPAPAPAAAAPAKPAQPGLQLTPSPSPRASRDQVVKLCMAMDNIGIKDRQSVLATVKGWCGRKVASRNELSVGECSVCIDAAEKVLAAQKAVTTTPPREPGQEG